jgi:hypothetical protein
VNVFAFRMGSLVTVVANLKSRERSSFVILSTTLQNTAIEGSF